LFDSGELRLVLLALIAEQPRHGYDLIRAIEERTGGDYAPSPGVVYPTITMLQDMALIDEQKGEGSRRLFAITEEGRRHLEEHGAEIEALFARLDALAAMREKTDGGPVRRAMHNLRSVLQQRLAGDDVDRETLHDVAAMLDEVAQKIERL
jgi:DNA-binding PadR family transcriptional regulator